MKRDCKQSVLTVCFCDTRTARPSSVPAALSAATLQKAPPFRGNAPRLDDSLYAALELKLRTKWFLTLKNAFSAFDLLQRGSVSKEALYRILCNTLDQGVTRKQFIQLMERSDYEECHTKTLFVLSSDSDLLTSSRLVFWSS